VVTQRMAPDAARYNVRIRPACNLIWVTLTDSLASPSSSLLLSIIGTKGRAMEAVVHLVNDTLEFYKWSLTIAGKIFTITYLCK